MLNRIHRAIRDLWADILHVPAIFYLAAFFLMGVKCGYLFLPLSVAVALVVASIVVFVLSRRVKQLSRCSKLVVLALFFSVGGVRSAYQVYRAESDLEFVASVEKAVEVRCRVLEIISVKRLKGRSARYRLTVKHPQVTREGRALSLPLTVNWYGDYEPSVTAVPAAGEEWLFKGRVYRVKTRGGVGLVVNSGEDSSKRLRAVDPYGWEQRLARFRNDAAQRIAYGITDRKHVVEINQAILLGFKQNMPRSMKKVFVCSGTIHVFAISGLHIALIASVMVFIVSTCGVPRYLWIFILAPLLMAYTLVTGMRPSAVRATLMALFFFASPAFGRRFNALAALACAALVVHLVSPVYISDIGSILSFSVMLGLVILYKPIFHLLEILFRVNALRLNVDLLSAAQELKAAHRLEKRVQLLSFLAGLFAVTIAAWLTSMPLSAYFFGRVTPGGLVANLVISPCALMLVIAGVVGFATSFISVALASIFNNATAFFALVMLRTAEFISSVPASNFEVGCFPAWLVWCCFAVLLSGTWLLRRWIDRRESGMEWIGEGGG